jgi:large subunit ribosomal protein L18
MASLSESRTARKNRIRRKLSGTTARPRLTVYKSLKHMYAQVVDDSTGRTLASVTSNTKAFKAGVGEMKKTEVSKKIGEAIAKACLEKNVKDVVFDRNGFPYHGRIAAVADGARAGGLNF